MTDRYLSSVDGDDGDSGLTWALAKATFTSALSGISSADTIYVKASHSETLGGSKSYVFPIDSGLRLICVGPTTTNEPPVTSDLDVMDPASEGWTTPDGNFFAFNGSFYMRGLSFVTAVSSGTGADILIGNDAARQDSQIWDICTLGTRSISAGAFVQIGNLGQAARFKFIDCTIFFGGVGQSVVVHAETLFQNLKHTGLTPLTLFSPRAGNKAGNPICTIENTDIDAIGSTTLVERLNGAGINFLFRNCKLPSGVVLVTGSSDRWSSSRVDVMNCDGADTNYRFARDWNEGTVDTETTITRTGGATHDGTQYSFKMVSSANSHFGTPLESPEFRKWNGTVGSQITVTVQVTASELLQTDDIWLEVQYLGTSGFPQGASASSRMVLLGTPVNLPNAATDWDSDPASVQDMQLSVDLTAQEVGYLHCRVMFAKPSTTVYVDPKAVLS